MGITMRSSSKTDGIGRCWPIASMGFRHDLPVFRADARSRDRRCVGGDLDEVVREATVRSVLHS
jgi:hypothetical protein